MERKVAVVTGGNRGIGFEICRRLAELEEVEVILTARHTGRGQAAAGRLQEQGLETVFHPLEVTDQNSVRRLVKYVADHFGRLDILVNNAAIYLDAGLRVTEIDLALVRQTLETNFYGPLRLCQLFVPLMERHNYGRVVNLSSKMGALQEMGGASLAYRSSKAALNVLTRVLAAELEGTDILVNSVDPGRLESELAGEELDRFIGRAADTAVWLATLPAGGPSGGFFHDRQPTAW